MVVNRDEIYSKGVRINEQQSVSYLFLFVIINVRHEWAE